MKPPKTIGDPNAKYNSDDGFKIDRKGLSPHWFVVILVILTYVVFPVLIYYLQTR